MSQRIALCWPESPPAPRCATAWSGSCAGRTGALIVLGFDQAVDDLCDGGFRLDVEFSSTRLRELCKMDGAVVLTDDATRILRANVQLTPDSTIPTVESGTRHRTAERTGLQTGHPVIAVSHSMSIINLYFGGRRHVVADPPTILGRANQALATLQRYKFRLDEVARALSALEIEDFATLRDAMTVLQRLLMVRRIADELTSNVVELGTDGRLLGLQLDEMLSGTQGLQELLIRDYLPPDQSPDRVDDIVAALDDLDEVALLDLTAVARVLGLSTYGRRAGRRGQPARLPAAGRHPPGATGRAGSADPALRQPAGPARRHRGRPAGRRGRRRGPGQGRPGGTVPAGRVVDRRPLRSCAVVVVGRGRCAPGTFRAEVAGPRCVRARAVSR